MNSTVAETQQTITANSGVTGWQPAANFGLGKPAVAAHLQFSTSAL